EPRVAALEVARLAAPGREAAEQLGGLGAAAGVEQRERERELERGRLAAAQDARVADRLLEVGGGLAGLALAHQAPAVAEQREREVALGGDRYRRLAGRGLDRELELLDRVAEVGVPGQRRPLGVDLGERELGVGLLGLALGGGVGLARPL